MDDLSFSNLGAIPSPQDYRDIKVSAILDTDPLPESYTVPHVDELPVWHQRKIGACVGHAHAKYKQLLDLLETNTTQPHSARYVYALSKTEDGYADEGTNPRIAAKMVQRYGVAHETEVPNDTTLSHADYIKDIKPLESAKPYAIKGYAFVDPKNLDELKRSIIKGNGVSLLVMLGSEWWSDSQGITWDKNRLLPLKRPQSVVSGHQVYCYGYEQVGGRTKILILNSWSTDWCDNGRGWFWHDEYKPSLIEAITFVDLPNDWIDEVQNLPDKPKYHFWWNLKYGMRLSKDVMNLQNILKYEGFLPVHIPSTGNYLTETAKAVLAYQLKYQIDTPAVLSQLAGKSVGPKTRAHLNTKYG